MPLYTPFLFNTNKNGLEKGTPFFQAVFISYLFIEIISIVF